MNDMFDTLLALIVGIVLAGVGFPVIYWLLNSTRDKADDDERQIY